MGDLRPIGSEKLTGEAKLKRIMEIADYNVPHEKKETNPLQNESYKIKLTDGFDYRIVFERNGYIIQKGLNEDYDYLDRIENRKYYPSYSEAFKRLNLIVMEVNLQQGHEAGMSLFGEQKKFVLKTPKNDPAPVEMDLPAPEVETPPMELPQPDESLPLEDPIPSDDLDPEGDEDISFKQIQKLTGRLGQKLREYGSAKTVTSKDMKYVINSILSAMDIENLMDSDREDILSRFDDLGGVEPEMDELPAESEPQMDEDVDDESVFTSSIVDDIFAESESEKNFVKEISALKREIGRSGKQRIAEDHMEDDGLVSRFKEVVLDRVDPTDPVIDVKSSGTEATWFDDNDNYVCRCTFNNFNFHFDDGIWEEVRGESNISNGDLREFLTDMVREHFKINNARVVMGNSLKEPSSRIREIADTAMKVGRLAESDVQTKKSIKLLREHNVKFMGRSRKGELGFKSKNGKTIKITPQGKVFIK